MQTIIVIVEDRFTPNSLAITLACIVGSSLAAICVSLNVVEIGLSVLGGIPWPS
jgi:hypothetical protein